MNEAIRVATEKGGYDHDCQFLIDMKVNRGDTMFLLDPLFWQSLGKALGWEKRYRFRWIEIGEVDNGTLNGGKLPEWHFHAQHYYQTLLTGGETEKFWKELLS